MLQKDVFRWSPPIFVDEELPGSSSCSGADLPEEQQVGSGSSGTAGENRDSQPAEETGTFLWQHLDSLSSGSPEIVSTPISDKESSEEVAAPSDGHAASSKALLSLETERHKSGGDKTEKDVQAGPFCQVVPEELANDIVMDRGKAVVVPGGPDGLGKERTVVLGPDNGQLDVSVPSTSQAENIPVIDEDSPTAAVDTSNHISATPVHIHISSSTPAATTKSTVPFSQPSCEGAEEEEEDGVKLLMVVDKPASRAVKARFPDDLVSSSAPVGSSCSPIRVHSKTTKSDAESSDTSDSVAEIGRVTKNPGVGVRVVTPVQLNRFVSKKASGRDYGRGDDSHDPVIGGPHLVGDGHSAQVDGHDLAVGCRDLLTGICDPEAPPAAAYDRLVMEEEESVVPEFTCDICTKGFAAIGELSDHKRSDHLVDNISDDETPESISGEQIFSFIIFRTRL